MSFFSRFFLGQLILACNCVSAAGTEQAPTHLRVGVAQMTLSRTIAENRARIVTGISNAAARGVRVAVWNDGFASDYKFRFTKWSVIEQDVHWVQIGDHPET